MSKLTSNIKSWKFQNYVFVVTRGAAHRVEGTREYASPREGTFLAKAFFHGAAHERG